MMGTVIGATAMAGGLDMGHGPVFSEISKAPMASPKERTNSPR
jgi:hypothetical protein